MTLDFFISRGFGLDSPSSLASLATAIRTGKADSAVLEALLARGAKIGTIAEDDSYTALDVAYANGCYANARWLLDHGANPLSAHHDIGNALHGLLRALPPRSPDLPFRDALDTLLAHGIDINAPSPEGSTALHLAVLHQKPATIAALLERGADPTITDREGLTPLLRAAHGGCAASLAALLESGCPLPERNDDGETPLHFLCQSSHAEELGFPIAVKLLHERGVDLDAQDRFGATALMACARLGQVDQILALVNAGARVTIRDCDGQTAVALLSLYEARNTDDFFKESTDDARSLLLAAQARETMAHQLQAMRSALTLG